MCPLIVLPLARIGTVVSSPVQPFCCQDMGLDQGMERPQTMAQAPTWSASVETLRSMPSRA